MNKKVFQRKGRNRVYILAEHRPAKPAPPPSERRLFESLREMIGLLSAGAGIFVALLYLAGRSFASGYFEAMNIPVYRVSFSLWEYGEVAWLPMLLYAVGMLSLSGVFWGLIYAVRDLLSPLMARFWNWLKKMLKIKLPAWHLPEINRQARRWFALGMFAFMIFLFILTVEGTLLFVRNWGEAAGQNAVLEKAAQVELVSAVPLTLDTPIVVSTQAGGQESQYYVYSGFRLLTFNDGKYYLFKEIDPSTCRPLQVYVIDADQKQVNLFPADSLAAKCQKNMNPQVVATPVVIPAATP